MEKQTLEIGSNYADIFGLDLTKDRIVYLGGIKFDLYSSKTGRGAERDEQGMYDKILAYINQPSVTMGVLK